jgi:hypothetical protein
VKHKPGSVVYVRVEVLEPYKDYGQEDQPEGEYHDGVCCRPVDRSKNPIPCSGNWWAVPSSAIVTAEQLMRAAATRAGRSG